MKLSTAIRIGSMTTKQIVGHFTDGGNGRCALGSALDAVGINPRGEFGALWHQWPITHLRSDGGDGDSLALMLAGWNDENALTRDQIADRVEQIEDALEHDGYLSTGITESKPLALIATEAK